MKDANARMPSISVSVGVWAVGAVFCVLSVDVG